MSLSCRSHPVTTSDFFDWKDSTYSLGCAEPFSFSHSWYLSLSVLHILSLTLHPCCRFPICCVYSPLPVSPAAPKAAPSCVCLMRLWRAQAPWRFGMWEPGQITVGSIPWRLGFSFSEDSVDMAK